MPLQVHGGVFVDQVGEYYITSEYTHHSKHCYRDGLLLVGDAFCFLDPVFSSGLMLALKSGVMAADAVHEALVMKDISPARFAAQRRWRPAPPGRRTPPVDPRGS